MSFLNNVRLVFSGRFQADVSTVNNDVRHYDNADFIPAYQQFEEGDDYNGWWNPTGSGAFRLIDCKVVAVSYRDGSESSDPQQDAAIGLCLTGSEQRSSGKLVDIDPQWQLASAPWGLAVRLTDAKGVDRVGGQYKSNAFRDLWFGRVASPNVSNDAAAAATFQSVLTGLDWHPEMADSRALRELAEAALASGQLSIRLTTLGYHGNVADESFTLGQVFGVIGPQLPDEPESFVFGRRFAPANGSTSWCGLSYFSGAVDETARRLFLDLSNAVPLSATPLTSASGTRYLVDGKLENVGAGAGGTLGVGILLQDNILEYTPATAANFLPIGEIAGYAEPGWLQGNGGVVSLPLNDEQLRLLRQHPLALTVQVAPSSIAGIDGCYGQVAIRETMDGLLIEAEPAVHRIDSPGCSTVHFYTAKYGQPLATAVQLSLMAKMTEQGGGPDTGNYPKVPIPVMGCPAEAVQFPATLETRHDGHASIELTANLQSAPRVYIEGQVYLLDFRLAGQSNAARSSFDYVVMHVRQAFTPPAEPTWDDIKDLMTQYANLYPVMSQHFIDLSCQQAVDFHARILRLAFSLPLENSNHMPVTRDLSAAKRDMILRYLEQVIVRQAQGQASSYQPTAGAPAPTPGQAAPATSSAKGKTVAAESFLRSRGIHPSR